MSADSRTCRSVSLSSRASAGTRSPAFSRMMSPGTSSATEQFLLSPITNDGSCRGNLFLNLLHRMPSLELHEEVQQHAEQNDGDDDQSTDWVSQHERYGAGNEKNDDQGIGK